METDAQGLGKHNLTRAFHIFLSNPISHIYYNRSPLIIDHSSSSIGLSHLSHLLDTHVLFLRPKLHHLLGITNAKEC